MQNKWLPKLILNLLVLITVIGFALTGWLVGHIFRFTIPVYHQFQHPPIDEISPKIESGFELKGRRIVASMTDPSVRVYVDGVLLIQVLEFDLCQGNTYYTSLPAKCRSADGQLVQVESQIRRLIPIGK